jgi:trans-aconitate methyltransferase
VRTETARVTPAWLELREPADAAARSIALVERLRPHLPADGILVIHDLGCGTGSMTRWLAPLLPGPQHWILHDRDDDLLDELPFTVPGRPDVTVETRQGDITRLAPREFDGAGLITASALLDMFTCDELERFVRTCVDARCPALITLTVTGRVEWAPRHPLDERIRDAFNDHQRRTVHGRPLLGPDAAGEAVRLITARGSDVTVAHSPWHLEPQQADLLSEWLRGWVSAAFEQESSLADDANDYMQQRLSAIADGRVAATIPHDDLLVVP